MERQSIGKGSGKGEEKRRDGIGNTQVFKRRATFLACMGAKGPPNLGCFTFRLGTRLKDGPIVESLLEEQLAMRDAGARVRCLGASWTQGFLGNCRAGVLRTRNETNPGPTSQDG
jgi:hypothetical protein